MNIPSTADFTAPTPNQSPVACFNHLLRDTMISTGVLNRTFAQFTAPESLEAQAMVSSKLTGRERTHNGRFCATRK